MCAFGAGRLITDLAEKITTKAPGTQGINLGALVSYKSVMWAFDGGRLSNDLAEKQPPSHQGHKEINLCALVSLRLNMQIIIKTYHLMLQCAAH